MHARQIILSRNIIIDNYLNTRNAKQLTLIISRFINQNPGRNICTNSNLTVKKLGYSKPNFLIKKGVSDYIKLLPNTYHTLTDRIYSVPALSKRFESTKAEGVKNEVAATRASKLKKAVAEYGSTVIVFHVTISLISLGMFYLLVDSGVDVADLLGKVGISDEKVKKIASGTGTFVLAYAVHKVFVPVRMGITLTATPFIVRHFRKIGWLKK